MSPGALKGIGIVGLVLCAILLFVAWERYQDNAKKVEAANKMMGSSPLGGMMREMTGGGKLEPGTPDATKYSLFFAALAGIGGVVCLVMGMKGAAGGTVQSTAPPT
jgi:hypothetical protein